VDALVIGRNTFETVLRCEQWPYGEKPVFVLSSGSLAPIPAGAVVEHLSGDPVEIVSRLEARGIRHLCRWRYNDSALSPGRSHSATDYHACSSADWRTHSALR
jgi:hypothetical protein